MVPSKTLHFLLVIVTFSGSNIFLASGEIFGVPNPQEKDINYWRRMAEETLAERLKVRPIEGVAKNLILFIGDGMSVSTITAGRIYLGQLHNQSGESGQLSFEKFPFTGLSKTYCVDRQVSDSASTATSYVGGVKANFMTIGVSAEVPLGDCDKSNDPRNHVDSLVNWALASGKATGLVTNDELTGASPSGNYAHTAFRFWQSDRDQVLAPLPADPETCPDIARQMVQNYPGKEIKVLLGGGRAKFLPEGAGGERLDGRDLVQEYMDDKKHKGTAKYVTTREELMNIDIANTDYVLGLFSEGVMPPHYEEMEVKQRPSVAEMTTAAIKMLQKEKNGFYLFVESAEIDKNHHTNQAGAALDETVELHKAVLAALRLVDIENTLIVVTADHAHTLAISGYPPRGNDILGVAGVGEDLLPYTTLSYATGPGAQTDRLGPPRRDVSMDDLRDLSYVYPALVPLPSSTHGGDDVAVFAQGPWAHLLVGAYEQNYIPIVMAYAARIGPYARETHPHFYVKDRVYSAPLPVAIHEPHVGDFRIG